MSRDDGDKRVSFALLKGHKSDSHLLEKNSRSSKMRKNGAGTTPARSKSDKYKLQSSTSSKSGKSAHRRQEDFNLYARSPTFQIEQAMSRLEIARAYGQSASERNKRKGGSQSKKQKSVRRTRSAGDNLCSKSTPDNLVIQDNSGMFPSKCTSYFDDSDIDISPQDWAHSSAGTLDNDPRDSRDTVSPASGQDPNLMSSACISELLTDGSEKVDRGVQTWADIGESFVSQKIEETGPRIDQASGGSTELVMEEVGRVDVQRNPKELDLKKRVEGLRQSVAAMRSEARMLQLHTEEQVLLKELDALTSFIKSTRKILTGVEGRPEFLDTTKSVPSPFSHDADNLDIEISHTEISTHQLKVTETNDSDIGRDENKASALNHHLELESKQNCQCKVHRGDQGGHETGENITPEDRMSVCVCSTASQSFKKHQIHVRHSEMGMDKVNLVSEEVGESEGHGGHQNGRIVGWEEDLGSSSELQTRQTKGDVDDQQNGNTQNNKTYFLTRERTENQYIHPELEEDCEGPHDNSEYAKCYPGQFALENFSKADASPRNIKSNGVRAEEIIEDPLDYSHQLNNTLFDHEGEDVDVDHTDNEQENVVSLEELSSQMMFQMHEDQLNGAFDGVNISRFADHHRDLNRSSDAEQEISDDSDAVNAQDLHDDSGLILADLEGILEKEVAREASGESDSAKSLDTARTWRLDFDIHDENASNVITDTDAEEYVNALESNRESVSSRELVTRTDPDYVAALVEEMMSAFLRNAPEYSQVCTSPVPGKVFVELQGQRKPNKDQSIFDRCIFETMNEIVSDTYKMCNRIGGFHNDDEGCIPLPPKQAWIYDTKDKILRAINHRTVHFDAIGTVLAQDAWSFHNSVMQIDDEINQLRGKLM